MTEPTTYLKNYLRRVAEPNHSSAAIAYLAALDTLSVACPPIASSIVKELKDQRSHLKLIASENFSSLPVQLAMGNLLTDKYSEGYVSHRFYAGCENVDAIEGLAVEEAKKLFNADHAYVQPHSGADANLVAFWAILLHRIQTREIEALHKKTLEELTPDEYERVRQLLVNQKVMGLSLSSGGHLTHGYRHNISSKMMRAVSYDVNHETGCIDYLQLQEQVQREKPLILIAGYSAYPRLIDFAKMREIADSVNAVLMVDMAHFAGLVAGRVMTGNFNPVPFAQIITSTTHKTLRGPRGGLILCNNEYREVVNKGCPIVLGGPLPHVIAAKAIAFKEASTPEFERYAFQVVENAQTLAEALIKRGARLLTNGTDNHLLVMDVMSSFGLTGRQAESVLRSAHLTANRNAIPDDINGPWYTSGVRLGTPAITTLGMKEVEMHEIASIIIDLLRQARPSSESRSKAEIAPQYLATAEEKVSDLLSRFPLYPEVMID